MENEADTAQTATSEAATESRVPAARLFVAFLRLGLTAFGGPAMVAYIRDLVVERKRWVAAGDFKDGVALCQSIPGATAMQTAAYAGLRAGGPLGALAAFVGFGLPAFALMTALSAAYAETRDAATVVSACHGLRLAVVAIIASAAISFGRSSIGDWRDAAIAACAAALLFAGTNPALVIAASAAAGVLLHRSAFETSQQSRAPRGVRPWAASGIACVCVAGAFAALHVFGGALSALATVMARVDLLAFGGGFASVPLMLHEVVDVRHWMGAREFMDGIALGQVTPRPIVITATFVGYQVAGLAGAAVATAAIFTPSFVIVLATAPYLDRLQRSAAFRRALAGVLASFVGLLVYVTAHFAATASWTAAGALLATAAFAALRLKVDILWVVLAAVAISLVAL